MRFWVSCLPLLGILCFSACEGDKDQYSGLSELVAQRNEARKLISDENKRTKKLTRQQDNEKRSDVVETNKNISSVVLYEKSIDIVDSESRRRLAKGVAYLNKSGQIVRIKIVNTR
ncbi:MAG TPA: hypothetical protein DHV36_16355 [Desulfobacteraceae bacterium]|nr:hypothetical protein [Desulfobacteraceae bacterium]